MVNGAMGVSCLRSVAKCSGLASEDVRRRPCAKASKYDSRIKGRNGISAVANDQSIMILWSFATALMPLRPFILESYFDAFAQGLLRTSSLASPEHFATDLKQETPIAPFTIRQERQITCLLNDLAQESHGVFKELAFLASTVHLPQKTGGPIH